MCGILGFALGENGGPPPELIRRALDNIQHRGPDDCGLVTFDPGSGISRAVGRHGEITEPAPVLLGATRLAILDLSEAGHQPFVSHDGRYVLVYNGEVYNYRELGKELEGRGHRFHSSGDTEVVLRAFETWGGECLTRFEGMFAFAVLDKVQRRLFLARDAFGIKPLYYCCEEKGFYFASQLGALLSLSGASRVVNPARLKRYLENGWSDGTDSETLLSSVLRFPPGAYGVVELDNPKHPETVRYWDLPRKPSLDLSFAQAAKELRGLFLGSVERHLRSDAPVASALSGGLDSSSIVAAARLLLGPKAEIHTFTFAGSGHAETDEEPWARIVSDHCRTVMHRVAYAPEKLADGFDRFIFHQDWPASSPVIFAQQQVFAEARGAGFKVLLSGQGPDEYMAGYPYHLGLRAMTEMRQGRLFNAARIVLQSRNRAPMTRIQLARMVAGDALGMVRQKFLPRNGAGAEVQDEASRDLNAFQKAIARGMVSVPLPGILRIEDSGSMACSVESRVPFLTTRLVDFVLSLPESYLVSPSGVSKAVFREAMRGITPDAILDRRGKMGFPVPLDEWLRKMQPFGAAWVEEAASLRCLDGDVVRETWRRFLSNGQGKQGSPEAFRLWRWIFLAAWAQRFDVRWE